MSLEEFDLFGFVGSVSVAPSGERGASSSVCILITCCGQGIGSIYELALGDATMLDVFPPVMEAAEEGVKV